MITYKVKPGSKLSQTWLSSLKFSKEGGFFRPIDNKYGLGFSSICFEEEFEPEEHLWSNNDMLDFAKCVQIAPNEFSVINEDAIKKWQSFKTIIS